MYRSCSRRRTCARAIPRPRWPISARTQRCRNSSRNRSLERPGRCMGACLVVLKRLSIEWCVVIARCVRQSPSPPSPPPWRLAPHATCPAPRPDTRTTGEAGHGPTPAAVCGRIVVPVPRPTLQPHHSLAPQIDAARHVVLVRSVLKVAKPCGSRFAAPKLAPKSNGIPEESR